VSAPEAGRPVRILVADDHTLLRQALCELLRSADGLEVVAEAGNGEETVRKAAACRPDVVLLDLEMPLNDPPRTVGLLLRADPAVRIIILSMHDDSELIRRLLSLGVHGYLHKSTSHETLASAIREHGRGPGRTVTLSVPLGSLRPGDAADSLHGPLSVRETQVLELVARALSNRQIGSRLGITEGTVKRHLRNVYGKLEAVSRLDAVNKAAERGLLRRPPSGRR
jgi:two-component system, NarL family, nitrate/nitrite response regulator NarL